jgi:hypothetical protein
MDTEHDNDAADAHMQAAGKIRQAEGSIRKALDDIQEGSRDLKGTIIAENNPSYEGKEAIKNAADRMKDDKKLPVDSEMEKAVERAKATVGTLEAARQAASDRLWLRPAR